MPPPAVGADRRIRPASSSSSTNSAPPSPKQPSVLAGKKLVLPIPVTPPLARPFRLAPKLWAASSITAAPRSRAAPRMRS